MGSLIVSEDLMNTKYKGASTYKFNSRRACSKVEFLFKGSCLIGKLNFLSHTKKSLLFLNNCTKSCLQRQICDDQGGFVPSENLIGNFTNESKSYENLGKTGKNNINSFILCVCLCSYCFFNVFRTSNQK